MKLSFQAVSASTPSDNQGLGVELRLSSSELRNLSRELANLADRESATEGFAIRTTLGAIAFVREEPPMVKIVKVVT